MEDKDIESIEWARLIINYSLKIIFLAAVISFGFQFKNEAIGFNDSETSLNPYIAAFTILCAGIVMYRLLKKANLLAVALTKNVKNDKNL